MFNKTSISALSSKNISNVVTMSDFKLNHNINLLLNNEDQSHFIDHIENFDNMKLYADDDFNQYTIISNRQNNDDNNIIDIAFKFNDTNLFNLNHKLNQQIVLDETNENTINLQTLSGLIPTYDLNQMLNYVELYDGSFVTIDPALNIIDNNNQLLNANELQSIDNSFEDIQTQTQSRNRANNEESINLREVLTETQYSQLINTCEALNLSTDTQSLISTARSLGLISVNH